MRQQVTRIDKRSPRRPTIDSKGSTHFAVFGGALVWHTPSKTIDCISVQPAHRRNGDNHRIGVATVRNFTRLSHAYADVNLRTQLGEWGRDAGDSCSPCVRGVPSKKFFLTYRRRLHKRRNAMQRSGEGVGALQGGILL